MRLECEVCNAAYTIDDGQLGDQPIGAQCPYCGNVKLVKKGDAPSTGDSGLQLGNAPPGAQAQSPGNAPPAGGSSQTCQVCQTPLTDEFDKVIGLCDEHQREHRGDSGTPPPGAGGAPVAEKQAGGWYVRSGDQVTGPIPLEQLRDGIRSGQFALEDEFSKDGTHYAPLKSFNEIAYLASLAVGGAAGITEAYGKPAMRRRGPDFGRFLTPVLLVIVICGLVGLGYTQRARLSQLFEKLTSSRSDGPIVPNPLRRRLANWRLSHPDVSGTVREHVEAGRQKHLEDRWRSYQLAESAYERALLLDENDTTAIAGWVENFAVWRYSEAPAEDRRLAKAAVDYARELSPESPTVYRAAGALALARGDLNGCRDGADGALQRDATDGQARLLLSGCYLEGNTPLAISEAERAQELIPEMKRADRVLAYAYARVGRYGSAFRVLEQRLRADQENAAVHLLYGDTARQLGMLDKAQASYSRAASLKGDGYLAHIGRGELYLEARDGSRATKAFRSASEIPNLEAQRTAVAYTGWARALLLLGKGAQAAELAKRALSLDAGDPAALLAAGEAGLMTGSATTAAVYARRALDVRNGEPAALALAARAAFAGGNAEGAYSYLLSAIENDRSDPRLKAMLAAMYVSQGGTAEAYLWMRRASDSDPEEGRSRKRVGAIALAPEAVREARRMFQVASRERGNAALSYGAVALLSYHLGDKQGAWGAAQRSLKFDDGTIPALVYKAQIQLDEGNGKAASKTAAHLLTVERGMAVANLQLGRAKVIQGDKKKASEYFQAALRSNSALRGAKVETAALAIEAGQTEQAHKDLIAIFQVDSGDLSVRQLLHRLGN